MDLNLMIATPAYGCMVHIDYLNSIIALVRGGMTHGVGIEVVTIGNNSLVPKARNSLISYFYENKKFSHLIFLDADIGLKSDTIPALIKRDVDIIGCPVPLKGIDEFGLPVLNIGQIYSFDETGLAEVQHVGNAVLMFSRKAVDDIVAVSESYFDDPKFSRGDQLVKTAYDVFKIGMVNGNYLPEDYYVCYRFINELKYKIYVDFTQIPVHNGMYSFRVSEPQLNEIFRIRLNKSKKSNVFLLDKLRRK
jgi:hypothetical protein